MPDPSLALEDHVFRIAENQVRLFEFLSDATPLDWNWNADLDAGTLSFMESMTGRVLETVPTFLIGSYSEQTGTFLWGWANTSVGVRVSPAIVQRFDALRGTAQQENRPAFLQEKAFPVEDEEAMALAIAAAGYLGCFTFYAGDYDGGSAFLAVERSDAAESQPVTAQVKLHTLTHTIAALSFDHRRAVHAYLGEPAQEDDRGRGIYPVGGSDLRLRFDELGRLAEMETVLKAEN